MSRQVTGWNPENNLLTASKDKLLTFTFRTYSPNTEVLYTKYDSAKAFSLKDDTIFNPKY